MTWLDIADNILWTTIATVGLAVGIGTLIALRRRRRDVMRFMSAHYASIDEGWREDAIERDNAISLPRNEGWR